MNQELTFRQRITLKRLKRKITAARKRLNRTWEARGRTDETVLAVAEELDILCNQYQRILLKNPPVRSQATGTEPASTSGATEKFLRSVLKAWAGK